MIFNNNSYAEKHFGIKLFFGVIHSGIVEKSKTIER